MANPIKGLIQLGLALLFLYPVYTILILSVYSQLGRDTGDSDVLLPLILFFNFLSTLGEMQNNFSSINYNSLQHQFFTHLDNIMIAAFLLYYLSKRYVISKNATSIIKLKPLTMLWETQVQFRLRDQAVAFNESLLRYLKNKKSVNYGFMVHISNQGNSTIIVGMTSRRFIPKTKKSASLEFMGLFHANGLDVLPGDLDLNNRKNKFQKIKLKFKDDLPSGFDMVNGLLNLRDLNIIVKGIAKFDSVDKQKITTGKSILSDDHSFLSRFKLKKPQESKIDQFDVVETSYFRVEVDVYIEEGSKQYIKSLTTFLDSLTSDTRKVRFFRGRKRYVAKEIYRLFNLPYNPTLLQKNAEVKFYNPSDTESSHRSVDKIALTQGIEIPVGKLIQEGREYKEFGLSFKDLKKGGIIAGAIGTGKTNFRLNLIQHLVQNDIHILDFDLKGDAGKQSHLLTNGTNVVIGQDIQINPFQCPPNIDQRSYVDVMYRSFIETLPEKETLTPPQLNQLYAAIKSTIQCEGDSLEFLEHILIHSMVQNDLIENYQEATAQALLNKLSWLHTILRDVFWVEKSSFPTKYFSKQSLYFDFSKILQKTPISLVRFLINFILTQFTLSLEKNETESYSKPNHVIFIDEGQLLMPKNRDLELTKLEEAVVTLRSKGVSIISGGVSADLMSSTLLDSGLIVQFRTASTKLSRSLSLNDKQMESLTSLSTFECVIRAESTMNNPVLVKSDLFDYSNGGTNILSSILSLEKENNEQPVSIADNFELDRSMIMKCRLMALFPELLAIECRKRRKWKNGIIQSVQEIEISLFEELASDKLKFKDILSQLLSIMRKSIMFDNLLRKKLFVKYVVIVIYHFMTVNDRISNLFPNYQRNYRTAIRSVNLE